MVKACQPHRSHRVLDSNVKQFGLRFEDYLSPLVKRASMYAVYATKLLLGLLPSAKGTVDNFVDGYFLKGQQLSICFHKPSVIA